MKTRFTVEWLPESSDRLILAAKVYVTSGAILRRHIGDVHFNGNEWMFIRRDYQGDQIMDGFHYIAVDPDTEDAFRTEHALLAAGEDTPDALIAELNIRRRQHRDSSLDLAELGAKMEAKKWWRNGYRTSSMTREEKRVLAEAHFEERDANHCGTCGAQLLKGDCPNCHLTV